MPELGIERRQKHTRIERISRSRKIERKREGKEFETDSFVCNGKAPRNVRYQDVSQHSKADSLA